MLHIFTIIILTIHTTNSITHNYDRWNEWTKILLIHEYIINNNIKYDSNILYICIKACIKLSLYHRAIQIYEIYNNTAHNKNNSNNNTNTTYANTNNTTNTSYGTTHTATNNTITTNNNNNNNNKSLILYYTMIKLYIKNNQFTHAWSLFLHLHEYILIGNFNNNYWVSDILLLESEVPAYASLRSSSRSDLRKPNTPPGYPTPARRTYNRSDLMKPSDLYMLCYQYIYHTCHLQMRTDLADLTMSKFHEVKRLYSLTTNLTLNNNLKDNSGDSTYTSNSSFSTTTRTPTTLNTTTTNATATASISVETDNSSSLDPNTTTASTAILNKNRRNNKKMKNNIIINNAIPTASTPDRNTENTVRDNASSTSSSTSTSTSSSVTRSSSSSTTTTTTSYAINPALADAFAATHARLLNPNYDRCPSKKMRTCLNLLQ